MLFSVYPLSPRRERVRVRGMMSPPPLSSPLEGGGNDK